MLFKVYFRKFQTFIKLRNIWNLHVYSLNIYSILSILFNLVSIHFLNTVLALVAQLCPTLCDPMDCSPPGSSVHGILQVRILEWFAISYSRGSSQPKDGTLVSWIAGEIFTVWATREALLNTGLILSPFTNNTSIYISNIWWTYFWIQCKCIIISHKLVIYQQLITNPYLKLSHWKDQFWGYLVAPHRISLTSKQTDFLCSRSTES